MKVYLVIGGEKGEGGSVKGVYLNRKKAMEIGKRLAIKWSKDYMAPVKKVKELHSYSIEQGTIAEWHITCDYVTVEEREVIE